MRVSFFYVVLFSCSLSMLLANSGKGQSIEEIEVTVGMQKGEKLESLFRDIEKQSGLLFAFDYVKVNRYNNIKLSKATRTIKETLDIVLKGTHLLYCQVKSSVIIYEEGEVSQQLDEALTTNGDEGSVIDQENGSTELFQVTGNVSDLDSAPMVGVNVIVKGTTKGTTTNADGNFIIEVNADDALVFSFIGYKSVEINVEGRKVLKVVMVEDMATLKEVVVNAGYWEVKDIERTGNISRVTADVIGQQPVTNPIAALSGRMPGVFIQQGTGLPGGDFKIEIRGRNSLRASVIQSPEEVDGNTPLYIVDGVPFSSEKVSASQAAQAFPGAVSPLTSLNTADIESIEILKDADATAIYGSRGANGVVLITTKKGKAGKTKFDLNAYTGAGKTSILKVLNTDQYLAMRRKAFANDGITTYPENAYDINGSWDAARYTNWQKVLIGGTAYSTSVQGTISGGNDRTQFLFSNGYRKETSVFPGDFGYQKGSIHLSINHLSENKKFSMNISVNGAIDNNNQVDTDLTSVARSLPPNAPTLYDENGKLNWENSTWKNPLAALEQSYQGNVKNLVSNVVMGYEIFRGLRIKTSIGLNSIDSKELNTVPSTSFPPAENRTSEDSYVIRGLGSNQSWIIEPQITWEKKILKGKLSILGGGTIQEQKFQREAAQYRNFPSNALLGNLLSALDVIPYSFVKSLYRYTALFSRVNYNWDGKYILNLTGRRDGSSRFGPGRQYANFGAIGATWIFTNESFITSNSSIISFGKLRASYGLTGSDQIGDYRFFDTYSTNTTQYQGIRGLSPSRLYNSDFAWETNRKIEGGIELGFVQDKILLNVSYYRNRSSNQLVNHTLPYTTGFNGILDNLAATVQNAGIETEITTVNFSNTLKWTTSFNITFPRNKLIEFPNIESSSYANIYIVGKSIYIQKFYESTGVDPETGLYTFKDFNDDGAITTADDQKKAVFVGQYFFGGFNNNLEYRGWKLEFFFQFVKQNGFNYKYQMATPGVAKNQASLVFDEKVWQAPDDVATVQRLATETNSAASRASLRYHQSSDAVISDASFIRLKSVSLSYQFPDRWTKGFTCRLYVQGQNLFVITKYKGYDPETQFLRLAPLRMITAGIQFTL